MYFDQINCIPALYQGNNAKRIHTSRLYKIRLRYPNYNNLYYVLLLLLLLLLLCRSQWPRGLRRRSAVSRLLGLWFRMPPGAWTSVSCECCVLSGRGLCDGLITRPEESYRLWCVVECDLEIS